MRAQGIHDHPTLKLGKRTPSRRAALQMDQYFTGQLPKIPVAVDHFGKVKFGLDGNDKFGVCGPTSVDNLGRLVSTALTGKTIAASQNDVFDLYRRSGNPNFDPSTGADDNGVDMQTMLEAFAAGGLGNVKPICFGRIDMRNDAAIDAAVAIFGGLLFGVTLQKAQQVQSGRKPPVWDYFAPHSIWGGHAVMNGRFVKDKDGVISWALPIDLTSRFRRHQLDEAWVVVYEWHLEHPAFLQGVDVNALTTDYQALTGNVLPVAKKLDKMSRNELDEFALTRNIDPTKFKNKDDLVAELERPVNLGGSTEAEHANS